MILRSYRRNTEYFRDSVIVLFTWAGQLRIAVFSFSVISLVLDYVCRKSQGNLHTFAYEEIPDCVLLTW